MTVRNCFFAGAASLALVLGAAAPAFAQYERQSTPAERAQTQQLNRNATNGRLVRPTPQEQSDYDSARAQYERSQEQYRRELDEYNARTQQYNNESGRYSEDRDTYTGQADIYADRDETYRDESDTASNDPDVGYTDDRVAGDADTDEGGELWTLDHFSNPNDELFNAPVVDIDGISVGHFRRIETRDTGQRMVVITLNSMRTVSIPIEDMAFDPDMSVVVAELPIVEIDAIPSGPLAG